MARPGYGKRRMEAQRKKQWNATKKSLREAGKALKVGSRQFKKGMSGIKPKRSHGSAASAPVYEAVPKEPLTQMGRKVRLISIAAAVIGGLLSLALPPLGSPICIAGVVCAICARRIAARFEGDADVE